VACLNHHYELAGGMYEVPCTFSRAGLHPEFNGMRGWRASRHENHEKDTTLNELTGGHLAQHGDCPLIQMRTRSEYPGSPVPKGLDTRFSDRATHLTNASH
jgi:hypothetical protein